MPPKGKSAPHRSEFDSVFASLRDILREHSARLSVGANTPSHYCLTRKFSPKLGKGYPVAWVKLGKAYVSFHFMPVYMFPKLRDGLSAKLRARMQGKSCFNFKARDEALFEELRELTVRGFVASKEAGY